MKYLKIEKFIENKLDKTINIPFFIFRMAVSLFPQKALKELGLKGIDFEKMIAAYKEKIPFSSTVEVREKKIYKRIVFSL